MSRLPELSIIIVNWNTKDILLKCLSSINQALKSISYEIILVDNGSTDGSVEAVKKFHPTVIHISNPRNLGFARAVNQGLKIARGKYWLLLNSDTQILSDSLEQMICFMETTPTVGILGATLLNPDGSQQNSFDNFPNFWSIILNKSLLRVFFPTKYHGKTHQKSIPFEVESVIGACILVRPEAVQQVGWLDEDYFVFLEETDWCYRMRKVGWRVMVHPLARIYHLQGVTKRKFLIPARIEYLSSLYKFLKKNTPRFHYFLVRVCYPFKLLIEFLLNSFGVILTFGLMRAIHQRWYLTLNSLWWHILGCPKTMTLKQVSENLIDKESHSLLKVGT